MTNIDLPVRYLPDAVMLVCDYLRAALPHVTVESHTRDPFARAPYVAVRSTPAGSLPHWRLLREASVEVVSYSVGDRYDGAQLADQASVVLFDAWAHQRVRPAGHIALIEVTADPAEQNLPGQTDQQFRFTATYRLLIRPGRTPDRT